MNSYRQGFKKLVLGTTLMCCAGMSTVEAGPWNWLENLGTLLYDNRGKVCFLVGSAATGLTCYLVFWKRHHVEPSAVENGENLLQLEGDTLAIQEREIDLEEETQNEEQAKEQAKGQLEDIAKQAIQRVLALREGIKERERAKWDLLVVRLQKKENLKAALRALREVKEENQKDLTQQFDARLKAVEAKNSELLHNNTELVNNNTILTGNNKKLTDTNRMLAVCTVAGTQALLQIASSIKKLENGEGLANYINAVIIQIEQNQTSGAQRESSAGNNGQVIPLTATEENLVSIGFVCNKQGEVTESANLQQVAKFEEQCGRDITQGVDQLYIAQQKLAQENKSLAEERMSLQKKKDEIDARMKLLTEEKSKIEEVLAQEKLKTATASEKIQEAREQGKQEKYYEICEKIRKTDKIRSGAKPLFFQAMKE